MSKYLTIQVGHNWHQIILNDSFLKLICIFYKIIEDFEILIGRFNLVKMLSYDYLSIATWSGHPEIRKRNLVLLFQFMLHRICRRLSHLGRQYTNSW